MGGCLKIVICEQDPCYLGIEIHASNGRFSGTTRIRIELDQLTEFANEIAGFPSSPHHNCNYEFGTSDTYHVKGYCKLRFYCIDLVGHILVDIELMMTRIGIQSIFQGLSQNSVSRLLHPI